VNAEFNWWLLIVGLVAGAGLVWFVLTDTRRRDADVDAIERPREAAWLSAVLADDGWDVPPEATERLLELHRVYLEAPPPDDVEVSEAYGPFEPAASDKSEAPAPEISALGGSEPADDDRVGLGP
jgi:hypothetical protein